MQGLQTAESITGNGGIDAIAGTVPGIIFTGVDHIHSPRGYMSPASPPTQPPLKCPRCDSSNTKFCYYNNYNLSQPRHFCKECRRYWTKGGVLRNVPVGGGCRKTKRVSGSNSSKPSSKKNCKRSASSRSTSDTSTVTSVDPSNTDSGVILAETCCTELPNTNQLIAPSISDLQCSFPNLINSHIPNELKEEADKTKQDDDSALLSVFDHRESAPDHICGCGHPPKKTRESVGPKWYVPVSQAVTILCYAIVPVRQKWYNCVWCGLWRRLGGLVGCRAVHPNQIRNPKQTIMRDRRRDTIGWPVSGLTPNDVTSRESRTRSPVADCFVCSCAAW